VDPLRRPWARFIRRRTRGAAALGLGGDPALAERLRAMAFVVVRVDFFAIAFSLVLG
jgi:hypothetical protein